jgi:hypothetical protein
MGVKLVSTSGGSVEVNPPTTASNFVATMPAATGTVVLTGVSGDVNINAAGANNLTFSTNTTERARIDSSGNLLVGTTTNSAGAKVYVVQSGVAWDLSLQHSNAGTQYFTQFVYGSTEIGGIRGSNTSVAYATSSDYRLKNTIAPMTGALAKIAALKPCTYKWNADGSDGQGFIAHELAEVEPGCVTGEKDAVDAEGNPQYQGIDTSFLVATLTAAIQELKAIVDAQGAEIAALKGQA